MSDFKIVGNTNPIVGEVEHYTVNNLYPKIAADSNFGLKTAPVQHQIKWEVYVLEFGKWRKTKENDKTGNLVTYKFRHGSLTRAGIRIAAIKGDETAWLDIKPLPSKPKIDDVRLLDKSGKKIEGRLSYGQTVKARVHCLHMEKRRIYVTLWEDDVKGTGHNKANETNFIETKSGIVRDGIADIDFLLKPSFAKIATKNGPENDNVHEYYVTAQLDQEKVPSNNVNVNAPEAPTASYKAKTTPKKEPVKSNLPVQQPKTKTSETPKVVKSKINSVNLTDTAGHKIKGKFKEKQIKVWINSTGLVGKEVRLTLYDEDLLSNDLLFTHNLTIQSDLHAIVVSLDSIPRSLGGDNWAEGNEQELFAEIEVLQTHDFSKSAVVGVDAKVFKSDPVEKTNKVLKVDDAKDVKKGAKGACACKENNFYWSNKLTCDERKKVLEVCANIWGEDKKKDKASELMAIMHLETINTFSPSKKGVSARGTKYVGLIQFSATTAQNIGTTYEALEKMTFIKQMDYVEKYLKQNKDKMKTIVDFYLQVIKPADVGKGDQPDYAVFDESISVPDGDGSSTSKKQRDINITIEPWVTKYGYASNPTFMTEKDEKVKRKRWVYTRQVFEERYGTIGGKTTIKEIDYVLRNEHYIPGAKQLFTGNCDDTIDEKIETKGELAPWMKVAWEEYEKYKGIKEEDSPLKEKIKEYFKETGYNSDYKDAWCASFVNWCFNYTENYKDTNSKGAMGARDWGPEGNSYIAGSGKDGWPNGEITDAFVGAVAVIKSHSHVVFIIGVNAKGDYVNLGGNQGSKISGGQKICMGSMPKSDVLYIMKPKKYVVQDEEKKLPLYDIDAINNSKSTR